MTARPPDTPPSETDPTRSPSKLPTVTVTGRVHGGGRAFSPGQILGERYRVRAFLGEGGMGEVWHAFDLRLRVDVALKSVRRERLKDGRALDLLRREVRSAREVISPNVCRIFDLVAVDGQELVSMEYIDGVTLLKVLQERGPLPLREAREIASQFLGGLEAIHQAGLVHRDVKPENVMITRAGRVVLMDFGLAKPAVGSGTGTVSGTPAYMAPEQLRGEAVDARADVFSAGVVLAEMVSSEGIRDHPSRASLWRGVHQDPPQVPESPWGPVLLKAVAKDPAQRHPSAHALTRALEEVTLRVEGAEHLRPYPGLASFTEADAEYFFGRELEVEALWRRLRRPHLLALVGPSGAGKSSFLRAGLIPALPEGWPCVVCTPGGAPLIALARVIVPELSGDTEAIQRLLQVEDQDAVVSVVSGWRRRHDEVLLIVDQFEELFTLNPPETQARFANLLGRLAVEADVHVLLSLRDDFLFQCHAHSALSPILSELTLLGPPGGAALRRALVQPALKCGYRFEDDALVDEMLHEVAEERGALPLLAFAMAQLWERRDRQNGLLTRAAYREIGGVGGALAQHAEATLERIGTERQPMVREIFRNLVTAQGTRAVRDREELLSVFPDRERADGVLRALIDARLLTSFEVQEGEGETVARRQRVEIIHESLLSAWPRLVRWQTQDADSAQLRDQLRQAAQMWQERGRPVDLLWTGTSYREFRVWRERYPGGLSATEDAFARAMVSRAERRRRQVRATVGGVIAALLGIVAVIGVLWVQAKNQALRAEASRLFAFGQLQVDTKPTLALAFAIASLERADHPEVRRFALDALERQPLHFADSASTNGGAVEFSPDGHWLAAAQLFTGKIFLLASEGGKPRVLQGPGTHLSGWRFGARSDVLLTGFYGTNVAQVLAIPDGRLIRSLEYGPREDRQRPLFISSDRTRIITASLHGSESRFTVRLLSWPSEGNEPDILGDLEGVGWFEVDRDGEWIAYVKEGDIYVRPLDGFRNAIPRLVGRHQAGWPLEIDPSGRLLATADLSGGVTVWLIEREADGPLRRFEIGEEIHSLRFDPTSELLAVGHMSGKASVWDLAGPAGLPPLELLGGDDRVSGLAFHPSGFWLATGGQAQSARLWPLHRPYPRTLFRNKASRGAHAARVVFAPDGSWVAAGVEGPRLRVWPLPRSSGQPIEVQLPEIAFSLAADPSGHHILVGTTAGAALVSLRQGRAKPLPGFQDRVGAVAFSPDGRFAAAGGGLYDMLATDRFIRVWDLEANTFQDLRTDEQVIYLTFLPDGRLLFVSPAGETNSVYRWTIGTDRAELLKGKVGGGELDFDLSPDGARLLVSSFSDGAVLYDLQGAGSRLLAPAVKRCRFNRGGTLMVCGDRLGSVRVIPLDGRASYDLVGHKGRLNQVAVSADDRFIVSAGSDGTVRLWPMLERDPLLPLPREEFVERLRSFTNLRTVLDDQSPSGWRLEHDPPNPGWETLPPW